MALKSEELRYEADGLQMSGQFMWDDAADGPRPGVLVFPEAFGLGGHALGKAERLVTELGYTALACDLHGERKVYTKLEEVMPLLGELRSSANSMRARTGKALESLVARPEVDSSRTAAMGFCIGGAMSFELALAGADIKAAIGFHSGLELTSPQDAGQIKGKVLAMLGADDPGITPEHRTAFQDMLTGAGVDWQVHLYGGVVHSYTNPDAAAMGMPDFARYDAKADERSWNSMALLLKEVFA